MNLYEFQSSPAPRRGRYPFCRGESVANICVSILARAEARALLRFGVAELRPNMFQSSPAPRRGRYNEC